MPRKKSNLKSSLIDAGIIQIKKRGINELSLREITNKCNVSHSSLYKYFPHKKDYLNAVMNKLEINFNEFLTKGANTGTAQENLVKMGVNFVNYAKEHTNEFNSLFLNCTMTPVKINNFDINQYPALSTFMTLVCELSSERDYLEVGIHLWSYIVGLSVIISNNDLEADEAWIKNNIKQMMIRYFD
ncbi:TetR/AcrR family transcriptional regulator [Ligilactobacillus cholophilus]|uniref:TetR/AcrR family transcriptional regulator n=1 Tax=Ligilactobacillus cholophilus TaxID=3050131 RepID=UPI0025B15552|nr:TetR/AcrR family transcriptional regulator [Ligilactobacillus cholophilus]